MPDDAAHPERRHDTGLPTVPRVTSALARRVLYDKPRRFVVDGEERTEREAIEIDVETDKDFPLAGTGPALFVGEAVIVDSLRLDGRSYRFFALPSDPIKAGATVALGRAGAGVPEPERKTRVRLHWQEDASE